MVPKGWEVNKLKNITKIYDGTHQTPKYVEEGVPFYSVEHLTGRQFTKTKYISEAVYEKECKRVSLEKNDILMTRIGDIGTAKIIDWNVRASFYVSLALIKQSKNFDSMYLENYINSSIFGSELWKRTIHVAFPKKINLGEIGECEVLLPTIPEQQKIAKILSTWDKAISTTERLIDNSTQQKKALMQQLLTGKKRLLDDEGKRFAGEWERLKLEDVVIKTQLGTSERTKDVEEVSTIPLIKMGNLTWGGFSFDKLETLPKSKMDESLILKSGDFLFNTRNTPELVGKSAVWKEKQVEATFDNNINRITFNHNINTDFMCLYLTYGKGKSLISSLSAGSTSVAAIYWKDLKNIKLPVPTLSEQQKIAIVLANADKEIELLEQQLADLQQEKKALMQVLLTGKKRVLA